jgi:hypothetical protein
MLQLVSWYGLVLTAVPALMREETGFTSVSASFFEKSVTKGLAFGRAKSSQQIV